MLQEMSSVVPIALFAYARPKHLRQTLDSLRANHVPLLYAFSDGPGSLENQEAVERVRSTLRGIDWCQVILVEREENLGLGKSILAGVTEVLEKYDSLIVFEDDLICIPGTYQYLFAALTHYRDDPRVMSVTGWTHARVTPRSVTDQPYFDGRAECWSWGTWARAWQGMDQDAKTLMQLCQNRGINPYRYGADLPAMAENELQKNIWAVRFLYLHMLNRGLCLRPPYSMVKNIGFDSLATNTANENRWSNSPLWPCPPIPNAWPVPVEDVECPSLWQREYGAMQFKTPQTDFSRRVDLKFMKIISRITHGIMKFVR